MGPLRKPLVFKTRMKFLTMIYRNTFKTDTVEITHRESSTESLEKITLGTVFIGLDPSHIFMCVFICVCVDSVYKIL